MPVSSSKIADIHLGMAKILRGAPAPLDWGFFSREDPRMHLQTADDANLNTYKFWLEEKGQRVLIPAEGKESLSAKQLKAFTEELLRRQDFVEMAWCRVMIKKGWLQVSAEKGGALVIVTAYPNSSGQFKRIIDVADEFPGLPIETVKPFFDPEDGSLVIEQSPKHPDMRTDFFLPHLLWEGKRG